MIQRDTENDEHAGGDASHQHAGVQQVDQGKQRGHDAAGKFDQAGADQVADAFDVAHDPGNQHAGFVGVVVSDLQAADVGLHFFAHFGNHAPGSLGEQLGERKRSESLDDGGGQNRGDDGVQQVGLLLEHHVVEKIFGGSRKNHAAQAVHDHQHKTERNDSAPRLEQREHVGQLAPIEFLLGGFGFAGFGFLPGHARTDFIDSRFLLAAGAYFHSAITIARLDRQLTAPRAG